MRPEVIARVSEVAVVRGLVSKSIFHDWIPLRYIP